MTTKIETNEVYFCDRCGEAGNYLGPVEENNFSSEYNPANRYISFSFKDLNGAMSEAVRAYPGNESELIPYIQCAKKAVTGELLRARIAECRANDPVCRAVGASAVQQIILAFRADQIQSE